MLIIKLLFSWKMNYFIIINVFHINGDHEIRYLWVRKRRLNEISYNNDKAQQRLKEHAYIVY